MFGPPRMAVVPTADLKVQVGTETPVALADAVSERYVQTGIFGYSQQGGYELTEELAPFGGYWIRCLLAGGCRLVFDPDTGATGLSAAQSARRCAQPTWKLPLCVSASGLTSRTSYLGAAGTPHPPVDPAYDMRGPAAFGQSVSLRFIGFRLGSRYVTDVRSEGRGRRGVAALGRQHGTGQPGVADPAGRLGGAG